MADHEVCHAHSGEKVGRPSALTPEVCDRIVQAKKAGCPDWVAAQSAGISRTTYYEVLRRAEGEESGPARDLLEAIGRAEADLYLHAMVAWRREMAGNWRARGSPTSTAPTAGAFPRLGARRPRSLGRPARSAST